MIKRSVTYKDFDGQVVTEDLYFNMFEPELVKFQRRYKGGLEAELTRIQALETEKEQLDAFWDFLTEFIVAAYGEKVDNKTFKKPEDPRAFEQTLAYGAVLKSFQSAEEMLLFMIGAFPADTSESPEVAKVIAAIQTTDETAARILQEELSKAKPGSALPPPPPPAV